MSECVVRMEMPMNCDECHMCGTASGGNGMYKLWCMCGDIPASAQRIPNDCPIVCQLPEGHGPLVDFNDVSKELRKYGHIVKDETTGMQYMEYPIVLEQNPIRIPTIVPAEAERSET